MFTPLCLITGLMIVVDFPVMFFSSKDDTPTDFLLCIISCVHRSHLLGWRFRLREFGCHPTCQDLVKGVNQYQVSSILVWVRGGEPSGDGDL